MAPLCLCSESHKSLRGVMESSEEKKKGLDNEWRVTAEQQEPQRELSGRTPQS